MRFFDFSGRARRREMMAYTVGATLAALIVLLFESELSLLADNGLGDGVGLLVCLLATLVPFVPMLACSARRLHDLGLSARWLWLLPVLAGAGLAPLPFQNWPEDIRSAASLLVEIYFFVGLLAQSLMLMLLPGQRRTNRFGPDPRLRRGEALEEIFH